MKYKIIYWCDKSKYWCSGSFYTYDDLNKAHSIANFYTQTIQNNFSFYTCAELETDLKTIPHPIQIK